MSKNGDDGFLSRYRLIIVFIVYSTLVLDNILLTVVGKSGLNNQVLIQKGFSCVLSPFVRRAAIQELCALDGITGFIKE